LAENKSFPSGEKPSGVSLPLCVVRRRTLPPAALQIKMSGDPSRVLLNTMLLLSGVHSGLLSNALSVVICRALPPETGTV
jgi:hypothetical protein